MVLAFGMSRILPFSHACVRFAYFWGRASDQAMQDQDSAGEVQARVGQNVTF